jgi:uncharacterized protein (DUF58 family)
MRQAQVVAGVAGAPLRRADPERLLRRLEWTVIRRLDGLLQGDYRTLLRGFGLDLADLREYQAHDDVRYIDWNVTARLQTPHVREFQEDREVIAWFLLDLSGSVNFGSRNVCKRELSAEFVAVLARLLTRNGNRIGAVLYDGTSVGAGGGASGTIGGRSGGRSGGDPSTRVIPARVGRRQVLHLLDRMLNMGESIEGHAPTTAHAIANATKAVAKETDLSVLLAHAQTVMKRRSVVFVVSDFISVPGWGKALALLARRHEIVAVRLYDPMELDLPDLGFVVMHDAETGEQLFVDTHDRGFRKRFAKAAERREVALRETLSRAGIDCLELATDDHLDEALLRFTQLRKRRSQLAAGAGSARKPLAR